MEIQTLLATVTWAEPRMRRHRKAWGVNPRHPPLRLRIKTGWTRPGGPSGATGALPVPTFLIERSPFSQVFLLNPFLVRHHLKPLHPFARRFVIRSATPALFSALSSLGGGFARSISASLGGFVRLIWPVARFNLANGNRRRTTDNGPLTSSWLASFRKKHSSS
jgi:hypothetical protein